MIRMIVLAWQGPQPTRCNIPFRRPRRRYRPCRETLPGVSPAAAVQEQRKHELKAARKRFEKAVPALVLGTPRERFAELLGSLLLSSLVAVAMTVVMAMVHTYFENYDPSKPEQCAWLLLTTIAGAWMVLIPSKLWEGTHGDAALRRFVMMVLGLGLGELAYFIANVVHGHFTAIAAFPARWPPYYAHLPQNFYSFDGRPMLMAYLAVFGALFFIIRWWTQADPLRSKRLRIWSLLVTCGSGRDHRRDIGFSSTLAAHGRRRNFGNRTIIQPLGPSRETKTENITLNAFSPG